MNKISPNALSLMLVTSLAESLLSVYQWMELLRVREGGTATCAINDTVNCAVVWSSDFASRVHALVGMPIASLGLLWGLTAFGVTVVLARKMLTSGDVSGPVAAAKVWAALGLLSSITFAVASAKSGAVCLTCLGTYALTVGFALPALLRLPKVTSFVPAAPLLGAIAVPIFLLLLWPGAQTPKLATNTLKDRSSPSDVEKYFAGLQWGQALATAEARAAWLQASAPDASAFGVHQRYGPADAPVKLVEFTDILCGHCRTLVSTLEELKKAVPPESMSIEPRYFPLDAECNPKVAASAGDGIRCLGAKVQICLEGTPQYWSLRSELFENQSSLGKEKILQIASKGMPLPQLQSCISAPQTQARINQDVEYASLYNPKGTPIVLLNGRETPPVPAFLYGMMMGKGDPHTPYFAKLPTPR